ncbi:DUF2141 domain-containing protein [Bacteroides helcogenes]|uniref:DUF2141 domain-containing protein n=1 Tax=Bacteroides helcogenes (strain ATCC 35417 / DSM 20613 / JCM 6297 / CCUG 15421 / P 36-108) TaxID=693979 RepID=E6SW97_BACT6|nr:DUF2141 domain-containing protein [Bacteroides helcogenes]ADV43572.1 hypothetical protein Bache_1567 [Bacteroides helcogenes P 36-108]MDY5239294.1 DUF2141 domain-containing protein [Bacteroides helcogenes]
MKAIGYKWIVFAVFSLCTFTAVAQSDLTVKVTNIPSSKGKVMIATDKGQHNMVDAKEGDVVLELKGVPAGKCKLYVYHDENGNYRLDKEDGVPVEHCAIVDLDVKADTTMVDVELADVRKKMQD